MAFCALLSITFALLSVLPDSTSAIPLECPSVANVSTIYQFPYPTFVENLAVRSNGHILATIIGAAQVWDVNPITCTASLAYEFPDTNAVVGISEVGHDIFAVATGNFSLSTVSSEPGSWSVWTLDLSSCGSTKGYWPDAEAPRCNTTVSQTHVFSLPEATFLNGLTTLSDYPPTILVGDSSLGLIYILDMSTGEYSVFLEDATLKPPATAPPPLGVNGIRYHAPYLYFTNSLQAPLLARVPIKKRKNRTFSPGPVEIIVESSPFPVNLGIQSDDFAISPDGKKAYIMGNPSNYVLEVDIATRDVKQVLGGGNSSVVAGATAAQFGRGKASDVLYIVTTGGLLYPPEGGAVGGKVLAWNTRRL